MASSKPSHTVPLHGNYHAQVKLLQYAKLELIFIQILSKRGSDFEGDERLALLPLDIFHGKRVLDIGCNEGYVTCEIAQRQGTRQVVGVDIDPDPVALAWKRRRYLWSLQKPAHLDITATTGKRKRREEYNGEPASPNSASPTRSADDFHYFSSSLAAPAWSPSPPSAKLRCRVDILPTQCELCDIGLGCQRLPSRLEGYSVVIALSVTKWIHLNDGDDGISRFFNRIYDVLQPGGVFVLEVQPSDSYHKARRMHPRLKAAKLELKPEQFGEELVESGSRSRTLALRMLMKEASSSRCGSTLNRQLLDCSSGTTSLWEV